MLTFTIKNRKVIYLILVAIILIPAIIGTVLLVKNQEKMQGYVTTKAKVVDYERKREYDFDEHEDKIWYKEIVEYSVDGKTYKATSDVWTTAPRLVGGQIKIAYDPNRPSKCVFVTNSYEGIIVCYGLSLVGVILLVITIVGYARGVTR
ncbi:MAG: DUF3592 domain-containing protein [Clostridia bacterium]|nr:DUF3592 domain-containing protein [Clostridia bacterium]